MVIDDFTGEVGAVVEAAAALAPFPELRHNYYPGLRRVIRTADTSAYAMIERLLEQAAPFVGGGFDVDGFDLIEASFSLVTKAPEALTPPQRAPHFDSTDPNYLAVLLYLSDTPGTGTAFYRQRATGIENVDEDNVARFVAAARAAAPGRGYIRNSDAHYEQVGRVEGVPDRLIIYRGSLLHSGIIPSEMNFSADPRQGRLTANIFIRAH